MSIGRSSHHNTRASLACSPWPTTSARRIEHVITISRSFVTTPKRARCSDKVIWYTAIDICRRWTVHIVSLHVTISVTSAFGRHVIRIVYHNWTITITSILLLEIHMMVQLSILCVLFVTSEIYIMCALSCWFIFGAKMLLSIWCDRLHCPFSVAWAYAMYWTQPCYL